MSNSSLVNYTKISPNKTSPRTHAIDTVTIHCVVGQCSVETLGNIFAPTSKQASSNYGIGPDGRIGMYVEEKDRSWCSSNAANDNRAITIEVASDTTDPYAVTDAAYKALIDLLVDICQRNNIPELRWKGDKSLIGQTNKQNMTVHRWFANKSCPGDYLYNRHGQIAAEVNARLGKTVKTEEVKVDKTESNSTVVSNNTATFKVGDVVFIVDNAKYYNNANIPAWVKKKNWIVQAVSGDRVVINKSEDGKNAINSAINAKYLELVAVEADKKEETTKKESTTPFFVKVSINNLVIRKGPGKNYDKTGLYTGIGTFTIVDVKNGEGSNSGWGKLKSNAGWISLDFAKRI